MANFHIQFVTSPLLIINTNQHTFDYISKFDEQNQMLIINQQIYKFRENIKNLNKEHISYKNSTNIKRKTSRQLQMSRQKKFHSKVFNGYNMDITIDRDFQHQKVWSDKVQETKHIQEMKQIDRIFQGVVKQRIFGTIITQKSRLSNQQYSILDRINKTITTSFRNTRLSGFNKTTPNSPIRRESLYSIQTPIKPLQARQNKNLQPLNATFYKTSFPSRKKAFTIDHSTVFQQLKKFSSKQKDNSLGQKSQDFSVNLNSAKFPSQADKYLGLYSSKTDIKSVQNKLNKRANRKQSLVVLKLMNLEGSDQFQDHFKSLSLTPTIFLYDIKITKQLIITKSAIKINPRLLQYFFYFFSFPAAINFRQFKKGIQKAFNSPINLIYFFTFRVLDESGNGFLTISDLFRFLQKYPQTTYIEQQLFRIRKKINDISSQLKKMSEQKRHVKPSLQQILIINHKLKADQVSELLKQSVKQQINKGGQVKLTCYSQSILSLQHDVHVRLKQYQLQAQKNQSQAINANKINNQKINEQVNQDGIRFTDFCHLFNGRRPKIFCILVNILTGLNNQDFQ